MRLPLPSTMWVVAVLCGLTLLLGLSPAAAQQSTVPNQAPKPSQVTSASQTLTVSPDGLLSRSSTGRRADAAGASGGSVSADGALVAFESASDTLDRSGNGNGETDVFIRDRFERITVNASLARDGSEANGASFDARLSSNGRYVAFTSLATDLIRSDTNDVADVFVHDLETGVTRLASIDQRGAQLEAASRVLDISDTGRKVLLAVDVDEDDNDVAAESVSLRVVDWALETVDVVGTSAGSVGAQVSPSASLSGSGDIVAFRTAEPLVPLDVDTDIDVYINDLTKEDGEGLVVVTGDAEVGSDVLLAADASAVFYVADDPISGWSLFRASLTGDDVEIASVGVDGEPIGGLDKSLTFGANRDGSSVVFSTTVAVGNDRNGQSDVFQRDLTTGVTYRISVERHGFELAGPSMLSATTRSVADNALVVAFTSASNELVPNDINRAADVFVATPASTCDDLFITVFVAAGERPTERDDVILGSRRGDTIDAGGGDDVICGGDGNDFILGGAGADRIFGEDGNDIIEGGEGKDLIDGAEGNDKLYGDEDRDKLVGGGGSDLLEGGSGRDRLKGGAGADRLLGEKGADLLDGGAGNDELLGGASRDKLLGRGGDDVLRGGGGNDTLKAGVGRDDLDGGAGNDRVDGGPGTDTCKLDETSPNERRSNCE